VAAGRGRRPKVGRTRRFLQPLALHSIRILHQLRQRHRRILVAPVCGVGRCRQCGLGRFVCDAGQALQRPRPGYERNDRQPDLGVCRAASLHHIRLQADSIHAPPRSGNPIPAHPGPRHRPLTLCSDPTLYIRRVFSCARCSPRPSGRPIKRSLDHISPRQISFRRHHHQTQLLRPLSPPGCGRAESSVRTIRPSRTLQNKTRAKHSGAALRITSRQHPSRHYNKLNRGCGQFSLDIRCTIRSWLDSS